MHNVAYWVFPLFSETFCHLSEFLHLLCIWESGYFYLPYLSQSDRLRGKKPPKHQQVPLVRSSSRHLCLGLQMEKEQQQFASFVARNESNSVSQHLRPYFNHHSIPRGSLLCAVSALLTSSRDPASAKVRLALDEWGCPERNTLKPLLALFTPWKAALVLMLRPGL